MRIALLGAARDTFCGVSDYTVRLAEALERHGCCVLLMDWGWWSSWRVPWYVAMLRRTKAKVVHLQYPAAAYRLSVAPLAVLGACSAAKVLTLHEWQESHLLRKMMSAVLAVISDLTIFTTENEAKRWEVLGGRLFGSKRVRLAVVPLGTNVGGRGGPRADGRREEEIVYFGLIRPKKGLETFLEVAERAWERQYEWRFVVIGQTPRGCEKYAQALRERAGLMPNVEWLGGLEEEQAEARMRRGKVAYLPYPDGVSERRGSVLAALSAGLAVVTTEGEGTTAALRRAVVVANGVEEAIGRIRQLLEEEGRRRELERRGREYLRKREWEVIARRHLELYEQVAGDKRGEYGAGRVRMAERVRNDQERLRRGYGSTWRGS